MKLQTSHPLHHCPLIEAYVHRMQYLGSATISNPSFPWWIRGFPWRIPSNTAEFSWWVEPGYMIFSDLLDLNNDFIEFLICEY